MSNVTNKIKDSYRNLRNVERFSPYLSENKATAVILIDTTDGACLHDAKSMFSENFHLHICSKYLSIKNV